MFIINADDLGRDQLATDNTLSCHAGGRLTSTSAMVFMSDSVRAAELALSSGIDVGLHINFSEKFSSPSLPAKLLESHEQICRFLRSNKHALVLYHPFLRKQFRYVFEAQLGEFLRLYGRQPSHFDGHQHMHLASNLLFQRILPSGSKVRRSFTFGPGEKAALNRGYRALVDRWLARRHHLTDFFFALSQNMGEERLQQIVTLARSSNVELMTHPAIQAEFEFLNSDQYRECLTRVQLGTYADLVKESRMRQ